MDLSEITRANRLVDRWVPDHGGFALLVRFPDGTVRDVAGFDIDRIAYEYAVMRQREAEEVARIRGAAG